MTRASVDTSVFILAPLDIRFQSCIQSVYVPPGRNSNLFNNRILLSVVIEASEHVTELLSFVFKIRYELSRNRRSPDLTKLLDSAPYSRFRERYPNYVRKLRDEWNTTVATNRLSHMDDVFSRMNSVLVSVWKLIKTKEFYFPASQSELTELWNDVTFQEQYSALLKIIGHGADSQHIALLSRYIQMLKSQNETVFYTHDKRHLISNAAEIRSATAYVVVEPVIS